MKNFKYTVLFALVFSFITVNAQEKKIKFTKGTLKICSSKKFQITGYDGNEVVIKSLHNNTSYVVKGYSSPQKNNLKEIIVRGYGKRLDSVKKAKVLFFNHNSSRKNGLKKLGKKNENTDLGIYFTIEQKDGELIFKDNTEDQIVMLSNESYEIKIPNSIKLNWETNGCNEKKENSKQYVFFNSKASSLSNFDGEVEISTSLNNMKLKDVTGPVSINSIGGNVTVEFDKKAPKKLYSIYSNNGFIDITLPENSDVTVDANSSSIFSDIDFNILEDTEKQGLQKMKLKLKSGKVKMKLNAGLGNIYLRKK